MHIFAASAKHITSARRWSLSLFIGVTLVALVNAILFANEIGKSGGAQGTLGLAFGAMGLNAIVLGIQTWCLFFGKPKVRVILTSRSIAVKFRGKPTLFFKRSNCFAYAPEDKVFYFSDGSKLSSRTFISLIEGWHELPEFIFRHWWPNLDLEAMKRELEETYPITRWALIPYFGSILIMFILAMAALIGGFTAGVSKLIVVALVGTIVALGYDWNRRHQWLLRRESERQTVRFEVSAVEGARIQRV